MKNNRPQIEIMDTTLRDGEQTSGVSFVPHEKLMITRLLLEELKVDRVEVASARVSNGEFDAVKMICDWAARRNLLPRVEVLGFVDGHHVHRGPGFFPFPRQKIPRLFRPGQEYAFTVKAAFQQSPRHAFRHMGLGFKVGDDAHAPHGRGRGRAQRRHLYPGQGAGVQSQRFQPFAEKACRVGRSEHQPVIVPQRP